MIQACEIYKSFGDKTVMHGVSCTFENGKTNLIIGKSGSGKTVLLKSLVGLYNVDRGSILYDGRDVTRMSRRDRSNSDKKLA